MRTLSVLTAVVCLSACLGTALDAASPVPRPAKDFRCPDATGKQISVAALKGKVLVVQFLSTTCQHCQAFSRMLTGLQAQYGPKGFQAVGVAFNEATADMVKNYVKLTGASFPVGYAPREDVLAYLGISVMDRLMVPQILIIDRQGQVRAQSAPSGSPELQDEANLRRIIDGLLK